MICVPLEHFNLYYILIASWFKKVFWKQHYPVWQQAFNTAKCRLHPTKKLRKSSAVSGDVLERAGGDPWCDRASWVQQGDGAIVQAARQVCVQSTLPGVCRGHRSCCCFPLRLLPLFGYSACFAYFPSSALSYYWVSPLHYTCIYFQS